MSGIQQHRYTRRSKTLHRRQWHEGCSMRSTEEESMHPTISLAPLTLFASTTSGGPQLWTPVVRRAVVLERVWWTGALVFLAWLTRSSDADGSQPPRPKREHKEAADWSPPIAA
jgi:hypothetical protein